jgi:hypothetical protein
MSRPIVYGDNALEGAIWTMTPSGPVPGKGVERLTDRSIGEACEDAGQMGLRIWHADRGVGASTPTVTAVVVAGGGYAGETITVETSPDDDVWTLRAQITPPSDTPQRVLFSPPFALPRYVRFTVTDPAVPVRFTELFISAGTMLTFRPSVTDLHLRIAAQVELLETGSGRRFALKRGPRRRVERYVMTYSPDTDRAKVLALYDATDDGAKPCWLWTIADELLWVRLPLDIDFAAADRAVAAWDIPFDFTEELP